MKVVGKAKSFAFQYKKFDESFFPMYTGNDIDRYYLNWNGLFCCRDKEKIMSYGATDIRLRDESIFCKEKILLRKTGNRIISTIDYKNRYYEQSLFSFSLISKNYNLKFILAILNSKIANFLFNNNPFSKKDTFPQIRLHWLKDFPIISTTPDNQLRFIQAVDLMLNLNSDLKNKSDNFINRLKSNFNIKKIISRLSQFFEYDFKDVMIELKKQNINLSLKQQDEWQDYFNDYKQKITDLKGQIDQTDREIDQMVYELYGLTPEEIEIVEKST